MKRFILTGAPGAGKTAILRRLSISGHSIVEEAATDIITFMQAQGIVDPWTRPTFLDAVVNLQWHRQVQAIHGDIQLHDRSVICTAALASYLRHPPSPTLQRELERVQSGKVFQRKVFMIRHLGFVQTGSLYPLRVEEAIHFERLIETTYRAFGFDLIPIPPDTIANRAAAIQHHLDS